MKNIELEVLKELGTIGNKKVVICRWSGNDEFKVQALYEMTSKNFGTYYKGASSYTMTELNELFKLTKNLKPEDFEKTEKQAKAQKKPTKKKA